jgi:hypothetical protein
LRGVQGHEPIEDVGEERECVLVAFAAVSGFFEIESERSRYAHDIAGLSPAGGDRLHPLDGLAVVHVLSPSGQPVQEEQVAMRLLFGIEFGAVNPLVPIFRVPQNEPGLDEVVELWWYILEGAHGAEEGAALGTGGAGCAHDVEHKEGGGYERAVFVPWPRELGDGPAAGPRRVVEAVDHCPCGPIGVVLVGEVVGERGGQDRVVEVRSLALDAAPFVPHIFADKVETVEAEGGDGDHDPPRAQAKSAREELCGHRSDERGRGNEREREKEKERERKNQLTSRSTIR